MIVKIMQHEVNGILYDVLYNKNKQEVYFGGEYYLLGTVYLKDYKGDVSKLKHGEMVEIIEGYNE